MGIVNPTIQGGGGGYVGVNKVITNPQSVPGDDSHR
jgi:hypothetical protein